MKHNVQSKDVGSELLDVDGADKVDILLRFAQEDYMRVSAQQFWLRFFSLGIIGAAANLALPLVITGTGHVKEYLPAMSLVGLAFVFSLAGFFYVNLSDHHDMIVKTLKDTYPAGFNKYFGSESKINFYAPFSSFMIFLFPCIVTLVLSTVYFSRSDFSEMDGAALVIKTTWWLVVLATMFCLGATIGIGIRRIRNRVSQLFGTVRDRTSRQ